MQRKFKFAEACVNKHTVPPDAETANGNDRPLKDLIYWGSEMPGFGLLIADTNHMNGHSPRIRQLIYDPFVYVPPF